MALLSSQYAAVSGAVHSAIRRTHDSALREPNNGTREHADITAEQQTIQHTFVPPIHWSLCTTVQRPDQPAQRVTELSAICCTFESTERPSDNAAERKSYQPTQ